MTSRRRDDIDARVIELDELREGAAHSLINELIKKNPKAGNIKEVERKELFYSTSGNPLLITWVVGQLGREGSNLKTISEAIKYMRNAPADNDPLEYIFGDLLSTLINREKIVLAAMTHFGQTSKPIWISKITDYPINAIWMVQEELANRSILIANKETREYYLPSLTSQFVRHRLPSETNETEEKLAKYVFKTVLQFGGLKNYQGLISLAADWDLISASFPHFIKGGNGDIQILCEVLDMFLKSSGLWDEWLWLTQQAEVIAYINEEYEDAGARAYKAGLIYSYRGQSKDVLKYADRAEKYWRELKASKVFLMEKPYLSYLRGIGYKLEKDYPKAVEAINEALAIWKTTNPEGIEVATALNSLGETQMDIEESLNGGLDYEAAKKNINDALQLAIKNDYKEGIVVYKGNLAKLALKQYEWAVAEDMATDALKLAEEIGQQDEIARQNLHLATAYLNLGYSGTRGLVCSRKAVEIFTRLRHKELPEAKAALDDWNRKMAGSKEK